MNIKIVDTTLRDGEQKAGIALKIEDKIEIAKILDSVGVYQIEAGIPSMGGEEKKSLQKIMELNLKSKVSAWNRMNIDDIKHSVECGVDIIHITVPSSDIQINSKLKKSRQWVIENMKRSIRYAKENNFEVTLGLEDASRANFEFLVELCKVALEEGASRVRYADTVGILYPNKIYEEIKSIKEKINIEIEIHAHNDFGMAIANSIAAVKANATHVDCTCGGIGERAGNCNYSNFLIASNNVFALNNLNIEMLIDAERRIMNIIKYGAN
jgi:homocitrate synthase NifV